MLEAGGPTCAAIASPQPDQPQSEHPLSAQAVRSAQEATASLSQPAQARTRSHPPARYPSSQRNPYSQQTAAEAPQCQQFQTNRRPTREGEPHKQVTLSNNPGFGAQPTRTCRSHPRPEASTRVYRIHPRISGSCTAKDRFHAAFQHSSSE